MTMNSTTSELMQDNSSIEYVSPEANPMDTVQTNELIFGQKHNDIDCALCPTARRACDRAWVTAKNLEEWSSMSTTTLWRWLGRLEKARRISTFSDMKKWSTPHAQGGSTPTTLYNLNVLNQLAMVCIDNEKLNEVSCQFSDILSEVETTGKFASLCATVTRGSWQKTWRRALSTKMFRRCAAFAEIKTRSLSDLVI